MPKEKKPLKIAVIGCGINGISCAISLAERGHTIHIYEKKTAFSKPVQNHQNCSMVV